MGGFSDISEKKKSVGVMNSFSGSLERISFGILMMVFLVVAGLGCDTTSFDSDRVYLRVLNTSSINFSSVTAASEGPVDFGAVRSLRFSAYKEMEIVYPDGGFRVKASGDRLWTNQPIDLIGSPLEPGKYTAALSVVDDRLYSEFMVD